MHSATLLYYFFAVLLSCVRLSSAQNDASTSASKQSDPSVNSLLPRADVSSSLSQSATPQPTNTIDVSTITSPPFIFSTPTAVYVPTLDEEDLANSSSAIDEDPAEIYPEDEVNGYGIVLPTPIPLSDWHPTVDSSTELPIETANSPSSPLSIRAQGPVTYCNAIPVFWSGGVAPYNVYYMLLEPNQTVNDYTLEYFVSTERSSGSMMIVQLGNDDMQYGISLRGLTRIRIQDATGTNKMTWVRNIIPEFPACGMVEGPSSPRLPQTTTVKLNDYTTFGSTTMVIATIDGTATTIFPAPTHGSETNNLVQPGPSVASIPHAPPAPTHGMQSGTVVAPPLNDIAQNEHPDVQEDASGINIVQVANPSSGTNGQGTTNTVHGQVSNSAANPSGHAVSNSGTLGNTGSSSRSGSSAVRGEASSTVLSIQNEGNSTSISLSSSSSSIVVQGVENATNGGSTSNNNISIVLKVSKQVFALIVALLASTVIACAGYAFFRYRKRSLRRSDSREHLF